MGLKTKLKLYFATCAETRLIKMSYIRYTYPLTYVQGDSEDYVFASEFNGIPYICDYAGITNNGIIELLFQEWETEDLVFKNHLLARLADKLNVKLRDKPLTDEEYDKIIEDRMKEQEEENK